MLLKMNMQSKDQKRMRDQPSETDHHILRGGSSYSALPEDYNCEVKLAQTSDGKTIVCYHPTVDIPYEHTKPIPRVDPLHNQEESHEQVLKGRLYETEGKRAPTMEELSKLFYTTKHRWYPVGQYHRRRMKKDHPKDR
ncbi:39S ribosomal protein L42, mitochondrial isoform X2 [Hyla sarda]|uniref:39S ribosomal protein L42, mitochondrial isoform X2 n=1 Tax=Hyla sarda TaxID=327740 RepID=UPI0024C40FBD|nr:39S ribosomal protein L42, mitochondrial isoform X2 [Hyla sarda]